MVRHSLKTWFLTAREDVRKQLAQPPISQEETDSDVSHLPRVTETSRDCSTPHPPTTRGFLPAYDCGRLRFLPFCEVFFFLDN